MSGAACLALAAAGCVACSQTRSAEAPGVRARVERSAFGATADGKTVNRFTLTSRAGGEVTVISYGATITSIRVPDRTGRRADVVHGFDTIDGYLGSEPYFGAIVGRYANRIAKGRFTLDGAEYRLATNNGANHLHGGIKGFDKVLWSGESFERGDAVGVTFSYTSADGEEGYPGAVTVRVTYTFGPANELAVDYTATTDKATPINLTQHTYFNLAGDGDILGHVLSIDADRFTPVDEGLIPTGELAPVANTPFDFRTPTPIGARIEDGHQQIQYGKGYDHNWVLADQPGSLRHAARLVDPSSGRTLDVATTEPGIQFYSGNFLDGTIKGKGGRVYQRRSGLCLETQHFPDSPNHANFPSTILRPGQTFQSKTTFTFGVTK
jgi:aldose 1-epimerase